MKLLVPLLLAFALGLAPLRSAPPPAKAALGINLAGPADWNSELPLADAFRFSRRWISQREGAAWGKGPELALDEQGWVTRLEPGCFAETPLCNIPDGHYPGGEYTLLYQGDGILEAGISGSVISRELGRLRIRVEPAKGPLFLRLKQTNPQNYIRNIRVYFPGCRPGENPWNPAFLQRWHGMACFRFMDWMETNKSPVASWNDRPRLEHATFSERGLPLELMVDLCNRQRADAWFCMPHRADDDYVRQFAQLVKERLDPGLKVYLEYSNEVWNAQFQQSRYAGEQGLRLGLGPQARPWEAGWHFTARRSIEIFAIWEKVFGGRDRLVRVLPSQAASSAVSLGVCDFEAAASHADALAIAPYISFIVKPKGKPSSEEVATWTVDQVLDQVESVALPLAIQAMQQSRAIAAERGLKLVCYEAGQHLVGALGGENNEALTNLLKAANAHPRMGEIYRRYFEAWNQVGGDLLCHFSSVSVRSKWGSWGLLQFADEDGAKSPKFTATMRWAKSLNQPVAAP